MLMEVDSTIHLFNKNCLKRGSFLFYLFTNKNYLNLIIKIIYKYKNMCYIIFRLRKY